MTRSRIGTLAALLLLAACSSDRITRPVAPTAAAVPDEHRSSVVATDVVYYLDGKEITAAQVASIDTGTIKSVEVIKGESARRLLGDRAAYGVVLITSRGPAPSR